MENEKAIPEEHEELFLEEARSILLHALELRDRAFTRRELEEMAAELDIPEVMLHASINAIRRAPAAPRLSGTPSTRERMPEPTTGHALYYHPQGLLVTLDHLLIQGQRYTLDGCFRATKETIPPFAYRRAALVTPVIALLLFAMAPPLLLFMIIAPYLFRRLWSPPPQHALVLHGTGGARQLFRSEDEAKIEALVQAVNRALSLRATGAAIRGAA